MKAPLTEALQQYLVEHRISFELQSESSDAKLFPAIRDVTMGAYAAPFPPDRCVWLCRKGSAKGSANGAK